MGAPKEPYQPYLKDHQNLNGPGDQRPTALQIIKDCKANGALKGKVILITGCSSGIGVETARALYETGAEIVMSARNMSKLGDAIKDIKSNATIKDAPEPQTLEMHLDSLESVRGAANEFKSRFDRLDILITNAGVMAAPLSRTQDNLELQIGTNHFAHFLLFQLLKPLMLSTAAKGTVVRVVSLSSSGHRRSGVRFDDINFRDEDKYEKWTAYGQSKTANIYMANEIDRRYGGRGIRAVSVHPGGILTDLPRHLGKEEFKMFDGMEKLFKDIPQGAATTVWAAVSPYFEDHGGVYLGDVSVCPPFDPEKDDGMAGRYHPHAYDQEAEQKLWKISCETVGVSADD